MTKIALHKIGTDRIFFVFDARMHGRNRSLATHKNRPKNLEIMSVMREWHVFKILRLAEKQKPRFARF